VLAAAEETGAIVTAEEHTIKGGLGGAVAEVITTGGAAGAPCPVPMAMIGVLDVFGRSGKPAELMAEYKLTAKDNEAAVRKLVARK
ncbi:MAG: transketolase family protein, partial [Firmicutes bacterium]|nr:transketolase family protein [Bacillota bacterium]